MTARIRGSIALTVALLLTGLLGAATPALASPAPESSPPAIELVDGVTAPVFGYQDAIRERVFIPVPGVDQDLDGVDDTTVIEIMRPAASDAGLKVPAIIDASPYFTTGGRGNEPARIQDIVGDGRNDVWPLFYDNYFVPRGYAVILAEMNGTAHSTGCSMNGSPGDVRSIEIVIDWLQGRAAGFDAHGTPMTADWHSGKAGMIGKSYDGTLANGVAARGVEGLTTIVPISAITNWYGYSRINGIPTSEHYPSYLAGAVTNPDRLELCAPARALLDRDDADETGDVTPFWQERDYLAGLDDIRASVLLVHGLNEYNVKMSQMDPYWASLTAHDVPRKLWLTRLGHVDPFDSDRAEWVRTLHLWFDHWLQGVPNGIMDEPTVSVESMTPGVYEHHETWPVPGSEATTVGLGADVAGTDVGSLTVGAPAAVRKAFTGADEPADDDTIVDDPVTTRSDRLVFLSDELQAPLRLSGTAELTLTASIDRTQSDLTVLLVDYGPATRIPRLPRDGIQNTELRTCWGEASEYDNACYLEVERRQVEVGEWTLSMGALNSTHRDSLVAGETSPVVPGQDYAFRIPLEPYDHVIEAGHALGIVVTTAVQGMATDPGATVSVDLATTTLSLPVVGGAAALDATGAFGTRVTPAPTPDPTPTPAPTTAPAADGSHELAATGIDSMPLIAAGLALAALGAAAAFCVAHPRRRSGGAE